MRHLFTIFVALFCSVLLAGCGSGALSPVSTATPAQPSPTAVSLASPTSGPAAIATMGAAPSATAWVPPTALAGTPIPGAIATLTAAPALKTGSLVITNSKGERTTMTVEIADTEPSRELGLMFRPSMPASAGMLFDFNGDTTSGFWMQNTILPLSIAFIKADGTIIDTKDMQSLDTTNIEASGPYRYALETNQGFFRAHNIAPGDTVTFPNATSALIPGMPGCGDAVGP